MYAFESQLIDFLLVSLQTGENFLKFDCCLAYSESTLSDVKRTRRIRQIKLSVLAKYAQFTGERIRFSLRHRRGRQMKLSVLGKYAK